MNSEQLIDQLKTQESILPQDILQGSDPHRIAAELIQIFESHKSELEEDKKFRSNYTELVNYIYLSTLSKKPEQRNKGLFNSQLITFLLDFQTA